MRGQADDRLEVSLQAVGSSAVVALVAQRASAALFREPTSRKDWGAPRNLSRAIEVLHTQCGQTLK